MGSTAVSRDILQERTLYYMMQTKSVNYHTILSFAKYGVNINVCVDGMLYFTF